MLKAGGAKKLKANAHALIEQWPGSSPGILNYATRRDLEIGRLQKSLAGFIEKHSPKKAGLVYPKAGLDNIVHEMYRAHFGEAAGKSTGDLSAVEFAKGWIDATDGGVRDFNRAGGSLAKLEDFLLPQRTSRAKLYKAGEDVWTADAARSLDWQRTRWPDGSRIAPGDRGRFLSEAYRTLKTGGDVRIKPGEAAKRGAAMGNTLDKHRTLFWKSSGAWLEMHKKYSDGGVFETMIGHLDNMGHRIAMLQTFGPSPVTMIEQIGGFARKIAADADIAAGSKPPKIHGVTSSYKTEAEAAHVFLKDAYAAVTGQTRGPEDGLASKLAMAVGGARDISASALLGSSWLAAMPGDFFTKALRRNLAGLPLWKSLGWYFRFMNPNNAVDRASMMRAGFINEHATRFGMARSRLSGFEMLSPAVTKRVADVVLRASLLSPHTQWSRFSTAAEFMGAMADWAGKSFDDVPLKRVFEEYNIKAADWDAMRAVPVHITEGGHRFLRPDDILAHSGLPGARAQELADKFMAMIIDEGKMSTIEASIGATMTLQSTTRPGTLAGSIMRSVSLFKNFPVTLFNTHIRHGLSRATIKGRLSYLSALFLGMTLMGAFTVQMREVLKRRDPAPVDDPNFWLRAALTGGGASLLGDFLFSDLNRFGQGLGGTLAGPPARLFTDINNLTTGNLMEAVQGKDTNLRREMVRFAQNWTPGTNIWYLRAALQSTMWDQLMRQADPKAERSFRRAESRLKRQTGQGYWWRPGQIAPSRLPDVSNMVR
ncbi:MAG: hypothetical protein Q8P46_07005 [Hyphomicrobiales bacterium]|nr:hypothetical protein [Hyphomicrobiales bacterium]